MYAICLWIKGCEIIGNLSVSCIDLTFVAVTTSLSIMLAVFEVSCTAEQAFLTSAATSLTREVTYKM